MNKEIDQNALRELTKSLRYFRYYKGLPKSFAPEGFTLEITSSKKFTGSELERILSYRDSIFDFITFGETGNDSEIWATLFTKDGRLFPIDRRDHLIELEKKIIEICEKNSLFPRIPQRQRSRFYLLDEDT